MCSDTAMEAARMIAGSLQEGGKLMLCGNGGSAGDSQHLAAEFVATLDHRRPRAGLAALAL
ncbi:MAG: SIS domain-containing protein, partial [Pseudomonadota bacterium]|nr:SIS domain-containing protein [Pseudomonadota bacterium]